LLARRSYRTVNVLPPKRVTFDYTSPAIVGQVSQRRIARLSAGRSARSADLPVGRISAIWPCAASPVRDFNGENRCAERANFVSSFKLICPVQPRARKYSYLRKSEIMGLCAHPASAGGAYRDRHGRGKRDAMDALVSPDERCERGRQRRVVLIPRRWDQVLRDVSRGDGGYQSPDTEESTR